MSVAPYKFIDRRSSSGGNNNLFESATQTNERKTIATLDRDVHRSVTNLGRRQMMSLGRHLYANSLVCSGAVEEKSTFAALSFSPRYYGGNKKWGSNTISWMAEHDDVCDIAGPPYNMDMMRLLVVVAIIVDGDIGVLFTEDDDGYPAYQLIPGHRIGGRTDSFGMVQDGPYKGRAIWDGVILNDFGRPLAYRVYPDTGYFDKDQVRDISVRDMALPFIPRFPGQIRGFSELGRTAPNFLDVDEIRKFEKGASKKAASETFLIHNHTGAADLTKTMLSKGSYDASTNKATSMTEEMVGGVIVRYAKAGNGSKIESVVSDRPTLNQQAFQDSLVRDGLHGIGWSMAFTLTPEKIGGASMRVVVDKINVMVARLQKLCLGPLVKRMDGYRVSKAMMKLNVLPFDSDWYKWMYQGPARITADRMYDSAVDIQEVRAAFKSPQRVCAERNEDWEDVQDGLMDWQERLEAEAAKRKLDVNRFHSLFANPMPAAAASATGEKSESETEKEDLEVVKQSFDAFGIGVRAGAITPSDQDEAYFRDRMGLPGMNSNITNAWSEDGGVRRPITLVGKDGVLGDLKDPTAGGGGDPVEE